MNDERHTHRRRIALLLVAASLAAAVALPVAALAVGAQVEVSFRVLPSLTAQVADDGLTVYANTPWVLTTISEAPDGTLITRMTSGNPTGGSGVAVPVSGLRDYSLVLDR